jgi:hypothetical protein
MTGPNSSPKARGTQTRPKVAPKPPVVAPATAPAAAPAPVAVAAPQMQVAAPAPVVSAAPAPAALPPAQVVAAAPAVPAAPRQPSVVQENQQLTFGLIVVVAGFVAIMIALWLVVINYHAAADATAVLGIVTTAIAGLGGAFFGVAVGQQGTVSANKDRAAAVAAKDEAFHQTLRFAAHMDPTVAKRLVD